MIQSKSKNLLLGMAVASLLGTLSSATLAQVTVEVSDAPASSGQVEELIVTGTSIRGIAPIGSAPISYGRADIENDAPVDVRDALSNVPQISNFGTDADQSTGQRFRTSGYQPIIHNLGIYSTLTLFNGHRMADVGGEAVFPDPSILPTIAVQRAEVIADGSSAIYGADAVAGVINMIYRRGVDGMEMNYTKGIDPETSWENTNLGLLWGNVFDRGEVMVAYEYSEHLRPNEDEFPFSRDRDKRDQGQSDFRSTNCVPPRIVGFNGENYSGPNLENDDDQVDGTYRCNPYYYGSVANSGQRDAALVTARFSLTDTVELWAEGNYSDYTATQTGGFGSYTLEIPSTSPFFVVPPGADPTGVTSEQVRGDYGAIFGRRDRGGGSKVLGWTAGADIDIGSGWQANVMLHHSKTLDLNDSISLDSDNLVALTLAGEFNPFDQTGNDPAVLAQIRNGFTQLNDTSQSLRELSIKADGPVFSMAGGDVMAAVGASYRGQRARQIQSAGCPDCSFYAVVRDDDLSRGVNAVFGEVAIPLVGAGNARPGIEELYLSFAGRYDKYDGLPGQFSPKAGFTWIPMQGLDVHGTWGESYTAPNIGLTTSTFGVPQYDRNDRVGAHHGSLHDPSQNYNFDIYNRGGGSPEVEPENASSWSLGFTYEPEFVQGLSAGLTYYRVEYSNLIYKPGRGDVLDNPQFAEYVQLGDYDPVSDTFLPLSQTIVDNLIATEPPQSVVLPGQTFNMWFVSYAVNIGTRVHAGLDYNVKYDFDSAVGQWSLGMVANQQLTYDEQVVSSDPFFSRMNTGDAQEWQTRLQTRWTSNDLPLSVTLISNFRSGYDLSDGDGSVDGRWVQNLTASYEIEELFGGVTLQARVRNLMDEDPPFIDSAVGYDEDTSNPYGRQMDLTVRARF